MATEWELLDGIDDSDSDDDPYAGCLQPYHHFLQYLGKTVNVMILLIEYAEGTVFEPYTNKLDAAMQELWDCMRRELKKEADADGDSGEAGE